MCNNSYFVNGHYLQVIFTLYNFYTSFLCKAFTPLFPSFASFMLNYNLSQSSLFLLQQMNPVEPRRTKVLVSFIRIFGFSGITAAQNWIYFSFSFKYQKYYHKDDGGNLFSVTSKDNSLPLQITRKRISVKCWEEMLQNEYFDKRRASISMSFFFKVPSAKTNDQVLEMLHKGFPFLEGNLETGLYQI